MKSAIRALFFGFALVMAAGYPVSTALAGADRTEWQADILDYSDCTDEWVVWNASVNETMLDHVTPSGQGHFLDHWLFEGTVTGESSGFVWSTKGVVKITETYSLDNSLTGGFGLLENALMKPMTPGAPRVRLDVDIRVAFNAAGELVVDRFNYTYHCVSK